MKIRCVVERITYRNPENGYTILKCRVKDYAETFGKGIFDEEIKLSESE